MKRMLLAVALIVVLPGCSWFGGSGPQMSEVWPTYKVPAKPMLVLPDTIVPGVNPALDQMLKNLYDMKTYAESLKIIIDTHNEAAAAHNGKVESALGLHTEEK